MPRFTAEQARAARAFLGWTMADLGEASGLPFATISNFENRRFRLSTASLILMENALRTMGVEFKVYQGRNSLTVMNQINQ